MIDPDTRKKVVLQCVDAGMSLSQTDEILAIIDTTSPVTHKGLILRKVGIDKLDDLTTLLHNILRQEHIMDRNEQYAKDRIRGIIWSWIFTQDEISPSDLELPDKI